MKIKLTYRTIVRPLSRPFTISRGTRYSINAIIVRAHYEDFIGYGEATENAHYEAYVSSLAANASIALPILSTITLEDPVSYWQTVSTLKNKTGGPLIEHSFLLCAIDEAIHGLYKQIYPNYSLAAKYNWTPHQPPRSSLTISYATPEKMIADVHEATEWPILKLKVGSPPDIDALTKVCHSADKIYRVDANESWTIPWMKKHADALNALPLDIIEQPLKRNDDTLICDIRNMFNADIIADESCHDISDFESVLGKYDGINIKLMKVGGLTPAYELLDIAIKSNMKVMIGCMTESSIGIFYTLELLPYVNYADLDGAYWINSQLVKYISYRNGFVTG